MNSKARKRLPRITVKEISMTAILVALTVIFSLVTFPIIPGTLEITLAMIPIVFGAILLGPRAGTILGLTFGLMSFAQCFGMSSFGTALFNLNPLLAFVTCVVPRVLTGLLVSLIYKAFKKKKEVRKYLDSRVSQKPGFRFYAAHFVTNLSGSILNTILFMTTLLLSFYNTEFIQGIVNQLGATGPFIFAFLFVGLNGLIEGIIAMVAGFSLTSLVVPLLKRRYAI